VYSTYSMCSTHLGVRLVILDLEVVAWCRGCEASCRRGRA
jgi:hypothetical protein